MVMIVVVAAQALAGHYGSEDHEPVSAVVWFWQYASVAWIAIVLALFVLSPHATK
jgi:heme/copper-type cytochrome/quinol oxidase subunit 3